MRRSAPVAVARAVCRAWRGAPLEMNQATAFRKAAAAVDVPNVEEVRWHRVGLVEDSLQLALQPRHTPHAVLRTDPVAESDAVVKQGALVDPVIYLFEAHRVRAVGVETLVDLVENLFWTTVPESSPHRTSKLCRAQALVVGGVDLPEQVWQMHVVLGE